MAATWRVLRNNWKKTVFFTGAATFGIRYAKRKYDEAEILRDYCLKALQYGNITLKASERPRKIIVFLNPAARKSTARRQFEKNVLPLLNLAGLEVNVVKTEHEGQAKAFMSVLDDNIVDAVVVAGGDGTVSEIVTGLLRRNDKFVDRTPVGVIPVGTTNTLARLLLHTRDEEPYFDVKFLCEAGMAIIRNITKPMDVMEIRGKEDKPPVYAVSHFKWGLYTDAEKDKAKYWYFGPLKQWYSFLHKAWEAWPDPHCPAARLVFSPPCDGCSKCYSNVMEVTSTQSEIVSQLPWWRRIMSSATRSKPDPVEDVHAICHNPECGTERSVDVRSLEMTVLSSNHWPRPATSGRGSDEDRKLNIMIAPPNLSKADFIKFRKGDHSSDSSPASHAAELPLNTIEAGKVAITPELQQDTETWFTIDSEVYEAMPISIKMIKNAVQFFYVDIRQGSS